MSSGIANVQARIASIQSQLAMLQPVRQPARPLGGAPSASVASPTAPGAFSDALSRASLDGFSTSSTAPAATASSGGKADQLIAAARQYLGVPYLWGGTDPAKGLDCSGFVQLAFKDIGIELPRVSADQARAGRPVASLAEAKPGDLVAFDWSASRAGIDHIGIYIGDNKMIVAPRRGDVVKIQEITRPPAVIRRVLPDEATAPAAAAASAAAAPGGVPFADLFAAAGARHGVSPALLTAVARAESNFNPRAVSHAGAQGLMQLMPATARGLGVTDSFDPAQAVDGAARLLAGHLAKYGSVELALAAYNAGPGAVQRYGGVPPYRETQAYVAKIMKELG
jgi:cell wall-associated NlpC family hydrolase